MKTDYTRTVIKVEILSDGPVDFNNLEDVHHAITTGDCSGEWEVKKSHKIEKDTMRDLLIAQGSDPSFLGIED